MTTHLIIILQNYPTELSYRIIQPFLQFITGTLRLTWDPQVKVTLRWTWVKVVIAYVHD